MTTDDRPLLLRKRNKTTEEKRKARKQYLKRKREEKYRGRRVHSGTDYEASILHALELAGCPEFTFVKEHLFALPKYRNAADFAWVEHKVALEIDGGIYMESGGGHRSVSGILRDIDKNNIYMHYGWIYYRSQPKDIYIVMEDFVIPMLKALSKCK